MNQNSPISEVKGIGAKTETLFHKIGVYTVGDILLYFPRTYTAYPFAKQAEDVAEGETAAVAGRIQKTPLVRNTRSMPVTVTSIGSGASFIELVWFRKPYLKNQLKPGMTYVFYGNVQTKNGHFVMEQPAIYSREQYDVCAGALMPVYNLTAGLTNNQITKIVRGVLPMMSELPDVLPQQMCEQYGLCSYREAIAQIHFPDDMDALIRARKRLVFDEFFLFLLGVRYQKEKQAKEPNEFLFADDDFTEHLIEKLPYALTNAQKNALSDVREDMRSPYVMQRLLQGDVGSGKTILAFLAMADASHNDYQSAIMAPTEVLARQHYETYTALCEQFDLHIPIVLLTGSMTAKQKRMAYEAMQLYPNAMIIGTHALIQEKAIYDRLALVITDEQHRFGVRQRETLANKGCHPHVLVMSATPIPRTLAIILYGDLDISVIDEVPAKRLPIKNTVVGPEYRPNAYAFMKKEIEKGHQAYVICPLVEASEDAGEETGLENVTDYVQKLRDEFPETIQLGLLHGKMKPSLKNSVMEAFQKNEVQILVSTTVVEVGVNVPNATVMMIENAERFGLAQLHQLRGRVGRGDAQSYCIMLNSSNKATAKKRLEILKKSNDGFFIASEDLKLRGPGDFFGIRQSGDLPFQLADIYQDAAILQQASEAVSTLLQEDPDLLMDAHIALNRQVKQSLSL